MVLEEPIPQKFPGGWEWPADLSSDHSSAPDSSESAAETPHTKPRSKPETHWKPRTCRICLETVLPTFHPPSEHLPGVFAGTGYVSYDSEDGRLIRPCKCKGSSRYVHESCLQDWRHADPGYGDRNYWNCPTCGFQYSLERVRWGRWLSSKATQLILTSLMFLTAVFLAGFIADPLINFYLDPFDTLASATFGSDPPQNYPPQNCCCEADENLGESSWSMHFLKGFASLGLVSVVKTGIFTFRVGGGRTGTTGRDRLSNINWFLVLVGIVAFLSTLWKIVRTWSRRTLEKAAERVQDVQGDDDGDDSDAGVADDGSDASDTSDDSDTDEDT